MADSRFLSSPWRYASWDLVQFNNFGVLASSWVPTRRCAVSGALVGTLSNQKEFPLQQHHPDSSAVARALIIENAARASK